MQDKQVITAAEQAAWHAGLDEGRAQAAPAAVAVPESASYPNPDEIRAIARSVSTSASDSPSPSEYVMAGYRAALAATPAAAAQVVLPEEIPASNTLWMFLTKGMTQSAIAGMPERDRKVLTERAQENWAAIRAEVGATVPVVLPEPDAAISEIMELVEKASVQRASMAVLIYTEQPKEFSDKAAAQERDTVKLIKTKLRALLAGVSAPAAQAINLLAADHSGMKVDYRGLFSQVQRAIKRSDPGYAEMLRQLEGHLQELGQRWYAGDTNVVDEILQLYCIERDARKTVRHHAAAAPQVQADALDMGSFEQRMSDWQHGDALDAARYRWLRSRNLETISQGGVFAGMTPQNVILNEEDLDQAVDAAIAAAKGK